MLESLRTLRTSGAVDLQVFVDPSSQAYALLRPMANGWAIGPAEEVLLVNLKPGPQPFTAQPQAISPLVRTRHAFTRLRKAKILRCEREGKVAGGVSRIGITIVITVNLSVP